MKSTEMPNSNPAAAVRNVVTSSDSSSELGVIKIHDNVLAALVSKAVHSVEGVSRLSGSAIIDNLAGMVGSHSRAIEIIKEDDKLKIVVKINVCIDTVIPQVATEVQRAVIEQVEKSAGIPVVAVDVIVQQLDDAADDDDDMDGDALQNDAMAAGRAALTGMPGIS